MVLGAIEEHSPDGAFTLMGLPPNTAESGKKTAEDKQGNTASTDHSFEEHFLAGMLP